MTDKNPGVIAPTEETKTIDSVQIVAAALAKQCPGFKVDLTYDDILAIKVEHVRIMHDDEKKTIMVMLADDLAWKKVQRDLLDVQIAVAEGRANQQDKDVPAPQGTVPLKKSKNGRMR